MAKEISSTVNLSFSKGGAAGRLVAGPTLIDMTGTKFIQGVVSIGTTDESLDLSDVSPTPGLTVLQNLDTVNYVEVGVDGTNYVIKINAGESCLFRVDGAAIHLKANTGACLVQFLVVQS